jgi:hypothetical protein
MLISNQRVNFRRWRKGGEVQTGVLKRAVAK